jgi:hypothetical protein
MRSAFLHVDSSEISSCLHRYIKSSIVVTERDVTAKLIDCGIDKLVKDNESAATSTGI